jgi:hypothetical protein
MLRLPSSLFQQYSIKKYPPNSHIISALFFFHYPIQKIVPVVSLAPSPSQFIPFSAMVNLIFVRRKPKKNVGKLQRQMGKIGMKMVDGLEIGKAAKKHINKKWGRKWMIGWKGKTNAEKNDGNERIERAKINEIFDPKKLQRMNE